MFMSRSNTPPLYLITVRNDRLSLIYNHTSIDGKNNFHESDWISDLIKRGRMIVIIPNS